MDWHNRNMKILIGICIAVVLIVCYRIFDNIQTERERAERMSRVQAVAVVTARPERRTIVPDLEFSGSLDPEWQADVAAKVDGRVERVYVNEGDRVTKGQVLAELEQRDTDASLLEARGNYMDAQTSLRKAERDLERYSKLYEQGARFRSRLPMITPLRAIMRRRNWTRRAAPCRLWNRSPQARLL